MSWKRKFLKPQFIWGLDIFSQRCTVIGATLHAHISVASNEAERKSVIDAQAPPTRNFSNVYNMTVITSFTSITIWIGNPFQWRQLSSVKAVWEKKISVRFEVSMKFWMCFNAELFCDFPMHWHLHKLYTFCTEKEAVDTQLYRRW